MHDGPRSLTIGAMLGETAARFSERQAVKYTETDYERTWGGFDTEVDRAARGLLGMGLRRGDHAAVWATNYPEWLVLFFATARIGVVLVTVNTNYKERELEYLLRHSDAAALFFCDGLKDIDCEKILYTLCPEIASAQNGRVRSERFPRLRFLVSFDNQYAGMFHWRDVGRSGEGVSDAAFAEAARAPQPDDVISIQYTSGTTGEPKGVMLTHYNLVNNALSLGMGMALTERDRVCIPVPFLHCFGIIAILSAAAYGCAMLPLLWYTPLKVMHAVEFGKCTVLHGVPTMFIGVLEHRDFHKYDYGSLRTGIMAGSNTPASLMRAVSERMHMPEIITAYGQTETSPGCTMAYADDPEEVRFYTSGRAMPFIEIKVIDPETGAALGAGRPGELCARGCNVMRGYYKDAEATREALDADGWLRTGDIAEADENGCYRITGRIKDMIIRGGERVSPKEIEDLLYTYPGVKDVAVVGVSSYKYGEEVCAVVVPKAGAALDTDDIKRFVGRRLAKHKTPSRVVTAGELPLTASGKVKKYLLREMLENERLL
jgi:fatty-acyl-CoA synthase